MKRRRGFSLVETSVAVALMAIIVVSVMSGFSAVSLAATREQQLTTLDRLARSQAELIKSRPYDAAGAYPQVSAPGYSFSFQVLHYNKNANPTFAAGNTDNGLQEIILTVRGPNGISQQLILLKELP